MKGLHVVFGLLGDHHAVDQNAGNLDLARVERAALGDALDLDDDRAARVVRRHRDGLRFQGQRLLLHRDVAVRVGRRTADDADVDRKAPCRTGIPRHRSPSGGRDPAVVFSFSLPPPKRGSTKVPRPTRVMVPGLPAAMSRNKWVMTPAAGCRPRCGWPPPAAAVWAPEPQWPPMHPADQAVMAEMVEAALLAIPLTGGIDQRLRLRGLPRP
jgi:hypothetical protein